MDNNANPKFRATAFICPHCCRNEHQVRSKPTIIHKSSNSGDCYNLRFSECQRCHGRMIWIEHLNPIYGISGGKECNIVFPINYNKKLKFNFSKDVPQIIANDLKEAVSIVDLSPRGACALLRLSLQKFLDVIITRVDGKKKNTIDESIKFLLEKNIISNDINNIMQTLRIVGNEAVHPGLMDLEDNKDVALKMFEFFNYLVKTIITDNKDKIKIFNMLPENKRKDVIKENELIAKILEIDSDEKDDDVKFIPGPEISTIQKGGSNIPSRSIL